jgi:chemotaxis methyl-accepting protein methylase
MNGSVRHDLSYISFEGKQPARPTHVSSCCDMRGPVSATVMPVAEEQLDGFISWVLGRAGLDATAYRTQPLHHRLPACLRSLKVPSTAAARELLERKPRLVTKAIDLLLIGATEFFREPSVFEFLRTQILPALAVSKQQLRIWSAACSSGAELYSMAILLSEAGLLGGTCLLGTDCRSEAIEHARLGRYDPTTLKLVPGPTRDVLFEPVDGMLRPIEVLRRQVQWKVANLLAGVEAGPWDIILWRNSSIYLKPRAAAAIWGQLATVLAPQGLLIAGKAEQPPSDLGLARIARSIYRAANGLATKHRRIN